MARKGKPLLVKQGDYWHYAHRERTGVQLSIENFDTIAGARAQLGSSFDVELEPDSFVPVMALDQLARLHRGEELRSDQFLKALSKVGLVSGSRAKGKKPATLAITEKGAALMAAQP